jgi:hypothetical protein
MKISLVLVLFALLGVFVTAAPAADVTGKWVAQVPGRQGNTQEVTFNLKADGDKLTGTVVTPRGEAPIAEGKVDGDKISFSQTMERGGNTMKMLYKGTVSGSEIKFTRETEGGQGQPREFTAKKQ